MVQIKKEQELEHELQQLSQRIHELDKKIEKQISFKWNVVISIGKGAGYAVGASIIAALLITFLNWTIRSAADIPVLDNFISDNGTITLIQRTE